MQEPNNCAYCGSEDIELDYNNISIRNGGFREWYEVTCNGCGTFHEVSS